MPSFSHHLCCVYRTTDFLSNFSWQFYLFSEFLPEIRWRKSPNCFHIFVLMSALVALGLKRQHTNTILRRLNFFLISFNKNSTSRLETFFKRPALGLFSMEPVFFLVLYNRINCSKRHV